MGLRPLIYRIRQFYHSFRREKNADRGWHHWAPLKRRKKGRVVAGQTKRGKPYLRGWEEKCQEPMRGVRNRGRKLEE